MAEDAEKLGLYEGGQVLPRELLAGRLPLALEVLVVRGQPGWQFNRYGPLFGLLFGPLFRPFFALLN